MIGEGTKTSETKSDKFEVEIKNNIEKFLSSQEEPYKSLTVSRYEGTDTKYYSDVKISNPKNNNNVWVEVKLNKYANLGGPSFKYQDGQWTCTTSDEEDHLTQFYLDAINRGSEKFISFCKSYLKTDDIKLPTDFSPELIDAWKKSGSVDDTDNDVQFITDKIPLEGFGEKIAEYYKTAKNEPVYYIQVDDELYIIDPEYNPLGLRTRDGHALKTLADAYRIGRIQFRAKGIEKKLKDEVKYYYSVVCDVKILADDEKDETEYRCSFKSEDKFPITQDGEADMTVNEAKEFFKRSVEVILEEWKPEFDDKAVNQWGENWKKLDKEHYVTATVQEIVDDICIEPYEMYPDNLKLSSVHQVEDGGHFIITIFGGCNGGGDNKKLVLYLAAVKKLVKRLVEKFGRVWLIDWDNDCLDDVWTLRLGLVDVEKEKLDAEDREIEQVVNRLDAEDIEALMMNEGKFEYRLPDKADAKPGQRYAFQNAHDSYGGDDYLNVADICGRLLPKEDNKYSWFARSDAPDREKCTVVIKVDDGNDSVYAVTGATKDRSYNKLAICVKVDVNQSRAITVSKFVTAVFRETNLSFISQAKQHHLMFMNPGDEMAYVCNGMTMKDGVVTLEMEPSTDFDYNKGLAPAGLKEAEKDIGGEKSDTVPKTGVKLWIDDIREAPEGFKWIKSVNEFIDYCFANGVGGITLFDTDHDAGDYQKDGGDYIRCFDYLEACGCEDITVHIHSANPVGANNIRRIITRNKDKGWTEIRNS